MAEYAALVLPVAVFVAVVALYVQSPITEGAGPVAPDAPDTSTSSSSQPSPVPTATQGDSTAQLVDSLAALPLQTGGAGDYVRDAFGPGWLDPDRNGCDARNDTLARDLREVRFRPGTNECVVVSGVLDDPYTGTTIDFVKGQTTSEFVQIDHVVPLALAWRSGASGWDQQTRELFANDPANLLAVDGPANQAKSDLGPAEWLPANVAYRCSYARQFARVLVQYRLAVTDADRDSLTGLLDRCVA